MQAPKHEDFALDSEFYLAMAQYFETRYSDACYGGDRVTVDFYISLAANAEAWELSDSDFWSVSGYL